MIKKRSTVMALMVIAIVVMLIAMCFAPRASAKDIGPTYTQGSHNYRGFLRPRELTLTSGTAQVSRGDMAFQQFPVGDDMKPS